MTYQTHSIHSFNPLLQLALACLLAIGLSACTEQSVRPQQDSLTDASDEFDDLQDTIGRQRIRIMELELRLLARRTELQRLAAAHEQAIQEVVRVKAKLRSRNSKAETVASLAEVKLALQGMPNQGQGGSRVAGLERARHYAAMGEIALEEDNVDGASYLVGQAKAALQVPMAAPDHGAQRPGGTQPFSPPVEMTVRRSSNVRAGPGTDTQVLTQMAAGTSVRATGYQNLWVRIQRGDQGSAWIHYSLLDAAL